MLASSCFYMLLLNTSIETFYFFGNVNAVYQSVSWVVENVKGLYM